MGNLVECVVYQLWWWDVEWVGVMWNGACGMCVVWWNVQCDRAIFYISSHNIPLCTISHHAHRTNTFHITHFIPHHFTSHLPSPYYTSRTNLRHNAPHTAHHSHIIIHHGHITCRCMQQWCAICGVVRWWQEMHHFSHHAHSTNTFHITPHHSTSHLPSPHYTSHTNLCHNAPHIAHHSHIIIHHGCIACRGMQQWCAICGGVMWW